MVQQFLMGAREPVGGHQTKSVSWHSDALD